LNSRRRVNSTVGSRNTKDTRTLIMRAYKFRSSAQIAFALDIIFAQRLHCADWSTFNDPREGFFEYSLNDRAKADAIVQAKTHYEVCCLSKTIKSRLLWAHYASGFDGLAIEVELPDRDRNRKFFDVIYEPHLPSLSNQPHLGLDDLALSYLKRKDDEWTHEDEVRIIQKPDWYPLRTRVKSVIVGHRFNMALLRALRYVFERDNIKLKRTRIEDDGVVAEDCPDL
jgi:hypothetical protein